MKLLSIDTSTDYLSIAVTNGDKVIARFHKNIGKRHSDMLLPVIDRILKKANIKLKDIDVFSIGIGPGSFTGLRIGVATVKGLAYSLKKPVVAVPTLDVIAENAKQFHGVICPVIDARKSKFYACLYRSDGITVRRISKYFLLSAKALLAQAKRLRDKVLFLGDGVGKIFAGDIEQAPKFYSGGWGVQENRLYFALGFSTPHENFASRNFHRERNSPSEAKGNLGCSMAGPAKIFITDWHPRAEIIAHLALEYFRKKRFVKPEDLEPLYLYSKECDITGR